MKNYDASYTPMADQTYLCELSLKGGTVAIAAGSGLTKELAYKDAENNLKVSSQQ